MEAKQCPLCKDNGYIVDDSLKGVSYCQTCGMEVDTNQFVSDIDFVDNKAAGTFIHGGIYRGKSEVKVVLLST